LKKEKKSGAKVGKKVVSSAIDSLHRRKSCDTGPVPGSENPDFFFREISKTGNFSGRKLKNPKKVGAKFLWPFFFRFEI
jgi:hypothetical protein